MKIARILTLALCGALATCSLGWSQTGLTLTSDGKTEYEIVVADDALAPEKTAAGELKKYLEKVTGAEFAISAEAGVKDGVPRILVGPSKAALEAAGEVDWQALGTDGIVIKTVGRDLVLAGGRPRGTIYAVYTFLQDIVGCRWYADDADELVPSRPTLAVGEQNTVYRPPFDYRLPYTKALSDPLFRVKLRINGQDWMPEIPAEYGGGVSMGGGHTLLRNLLPPKEYFDQHPEWYALRKDQGKRVASQVCLTNPAAREAAAQAVLQSLGENYAKWEYPPKIVSVSPEDNNAACQCDTCLAVVEREGSESGPLLEFVNHVAERLQKDYPDVLISTLAYWHTDRPPKHIKPRSNVLIHFGVLDRNHKLPISKVGNSSRYLKDWDRIASHVYMWDYDPHFANFIQPHPNHFVMPESLRFYRDHGVTGVFQQGAWGPAGEFMRMRAWVNAQMMWHPGQDERALASEFLNAYYGAAGPFLSKYIDLIGAAINRQPDLWLGVYNGDTRHWLTLDDLIAATRLFEQAAAAVQGDDKFSFRVKRARLSIDIVWVQRYRELRREAKRQGRAFLGPEDPYAEVERLARNEFGIDSYREWAPWGGYVDMLRALLPPRLGKTPPECDGLKAYEWEDLQEGRLTATPAEVGKVVDDPNASDGKALLIEGRDPSLQAQWELPARTAVGTPLPSDLAGRWRVYAVVRAEPAGDAPAAIVAGIYSPNELCRVTAEFTPGQTAEYRTLDLGVHTLTDGAKIWVQPHGPGSYGEVRRTCVDRFFLVSAGAG